GPVFAANPLLRPVPQKRGDFASKSGGEHLPALHSLWFHFHRKISEIAIEAGTPGRIDPALHAVKHRAADIAAEDMHEEPRPQQLRDSGDAPACRVAETIDPVI